MQQHAFVDESRRAGRYLLTAVLVRSRDLGSTKRAVRAAVPKGQQRIHFCTERLAARRSILDAFARLEADQRPPTGSEKRPRFPRLSMRFCLAEQCERVAVAGGHLVRHGRE
jgi:hypothetical protein